MLEQSFPLLELVENQPPSSRLLRGVVVLNPEVGVSSLAFAYPSPNSSISALTGVHTPSGTEIPPTRVRSEGGEGGSSTAVRGQQRITYLKRTLAHDNKTRVPGRPHACPAPFQPRKLAHIPQKRGGAHGRARERERQETREKRCIGGSGGGEARDKMELDV